MISALATQVEASVADDESSASAKSSHVTLVPTRMLVDARGLALGILAVLALIFALSWAEGFLVPLLLGIITAYTLNPLVAWLEALRIPRLPGTAIVMGGLIGALVLGTYSLRGEMQAIIEQLPAVLAD